MGMIKDSLPDSVIAEIVLRVAAGEPGPGDAIPYDPATVRIKKGRVRLPGIGWVRADCDPPPEGATLTKVEVRRDGDAWVLDVELEIPDEARPANPR